MKTKQAMDVHAYEKNKRWQAHREQLLKQQRDKAALHEMDECTFKPDIERMQVPSHRPRRQSQQQMQAQLAHMRRQELARQEAARKTAKLAENARKAVVQKLQNGVTKPKPFALSKPKRKKRNPLAHIGRSGSRGDDISCSTIVSM